MNSIIVGNILRLGNLTIKSNMLIMMDLIMNKFTVMFSSKVVVVSLWSWNLYAIDLMLRRRVLESIWCKLSRNDAICTNRAKTIWYSSFTYWIFYLLNILLIVFTNWIFNLLNILHHIRSIIIRANPIITPQYEKIINLAHKNNPAWRRAISRSFVHNRPNKEQNNNIRYRHSYAIYR